MYACIYKVREHFQGHKRKFSQYGFMKVFSCLANLLSFFSELYETKGTGRGLQ